MLERACPSLLIALLATLLPGKAPASGAEPVPAVWRSTLYPENGYEPGLANLETEKVIQDFSYAGYGRGEEPVPDVPGPIFNVTQPPFLAKAGEDSTAAIQNAINAAAAAGGGVVFIPAGIYHLSIPFGSRHEALLINRPNVVLRGAGVDKTYLLSTTTVMRTPASPESKAVIRVNGPGEAGMRRAVPAHSEIPLTRDVLHFTREIPVLEPRAFRVGDTVFARITLTDAWIAETKEPTWVGNASSLGGGMLSFRRTVTRVNECSGTVTLDVPIRHPLKLRDHARLSRAQQAPISGVGLEDFSIGNLQHPGKEWGGNDYTVAGTSAWEVHGTKLIEINNARDCWVRRVHSYQAPENTTTAHMLSDGLRLNSSTHVTIEDCVFQRPQYGGGGGNGYMFTLFGSQECLIKNSEARFSRHGFSIADTGASGNVITNSIDRDGGYATGSGYVKDKPELQHTNGIASDHHKSLSMANLIDTCTGDASWWEAIYRPWGGDVLHGVTATHSVFWNTYGTDRTTSRVKNINYVVRSDQGGWGYVIGTRGPRSGADVSQNPLAANGQGGHIDHVEGLGMGDTLAPFSLYADQLARRLGQLSTATVLPHAAATTGSPPVGFILAGAPTNDADFSVVWSTPPVRILRHPVADTFIQGDSSTRNANYGTSAHLSLKRASSANTTRHGLLRFLLCDLDPFLTARLVLTNTSSASYARWRVDVRFIAANTAWTETRVTWNNAPAFGATLATFEPSPGLVDVIDLTAALRAAQTAGACSIDLALVVVAQPNDTVLSYHSREHTDLNLRPRLELELPPSAPRFENWIAHQPGVATDLRAPMADPDADGLPNLLEMALGLDPGGADKRPPLAWEDGKLRFTFSALAPAFTRLHLEQSTDLVTWQPVSLAPEHIVPGADGLLQVSRPVSLDQARLFWRLNLIQE